MNFFGHLHTINHHKRLVMKYCFKCGLYRQGLLHDMSKYSPTEFWRGVKYYQGNRSPNDGERKAHGLSLAWLHHKGRNKHHMEYWIDYSTSPDRQMTGMKMPDRYIAEMVCDRIAACRTYNGDKYTAADPFSYYSKSKDHYIMHEHTRELLEKLLVMVRDEGEEQTFRYIRENIVKSK